MKNVFYLLSLIFLSAACSSLKLTGEEKALIKSRVITSMEGNDYTISVNQADPMRRSIINVSSYQRDPIAFYGDIEFPQEIYNQKSTINQ
jgi:hypothetical protein